MQNLNCFQKLFIYILAAYILLAALVVSCYLGSYAGGNNKAAQIWELLK